MLIARIIGIVLLLAAGAIFIVDVVDWARTGIFAPMVAGQLWFAVDRYFGSGSLNLVQAVIQRYIWPPFWDPVITTILLCWAWAVLAVPGALLVWVSTLRERQRRRPGRTRMQ